MPLRPARALAIIRIAVGVIFIVRTTPLLVPLGFRFAEGPLVGWPDGRWHIALLALPAWVVGGLAIVRTLAALCFTLGLRARVAGIVASAAGWLVLGEDALGYVNSLELLHMATLVVALADSSAELAVRPDAPRSIRSSLWLVRALPLSVYAFSGVAKLNAQFLSGRALEGFCADGYIQGIGSMVCSWAHPASIAVACGELALPWLLAFRVTRRVGLALAVAFHVGLELAMRPDVFGWLMVALLVAFLPGVRTSR
jgi:hypothetical protein